MRCHRKLLSPVLPLTLAALLPAGGLTQPSDALPDFGSPADAVMNRSQEAELGRSVMLQIRNAGALVEDAQVTEYIGSLGARLAGQASGSGERFTFFVVDDDSINAFALPGGYIGVNSGLIMATETESELAGVLAHEVSHVTQRHIARSIYDSQRSSIISLATMLAAVLLGAAADLEGDAMQGVVAASQAAAIQRQINFTRANEHEADRIGMDLLVAAGFSPEGMSRFFEKLARRYGLMREQIPALLQTHPVTTERIAEARARTRQLPSVEATDSVSYGLTKARLQVLSAATPEAALAAFDARPEQTQADRYGRALSLARLSRNDQAERVFRELAAESPGVIAFRIGRAETLMASGLTDTALDVYAEAIDLFPRNVPLTTSYAEALIAARDPAEAHRLLLDLFNRIAPKPEQIRLIARAANAEGDVGNAHYYMAEYYVSVGNLPLAVNQLRMALEAPDVHTVNRARFEARLNELSEHLTPDQRRQIPTGNRQPQPQRRTP